MAPEKKKYIKSKLNSKMAICQEDNQITSFLQNDRVKKCKSTIDSEKLREINQNYEFMVYKRTS